MEAECSDLRGQVSSVENVIFFCSISHFDSEIIALLFSSIQAHAALQDEHDRLIELYAQVRQRSEQEREMYAALLDKEANRESVFLTEREAEDI